jgi:hypothetical protein
VQFDQIGAKALLPVKMIMAVPAKLLSPYLIPTYSSNVEDVLTAV